MYANARDRCMPVTMQIVSQKCSLKKADIDIGKSIARLRSHIMRALNQREVTQKHKRNWGENNGKPNPTISGCTSFT